MVDHAPIVAALRELAALYEATGADRYRVAAYTRAAQVLGQVQGDLGDSIRSGRLTDLPGIGPQLAAVVRELHETGTTSRLDALRAEVPRGFRKLVRVPGLGPKRVLTLYKELGIADLDDLERACRDGALRALPGFTASFEERILLALPSVRAGSDLVLLGSALALADRLVPWLASLPGVRTAQPTGAVRRREEIVRALDLLVATDRPERVRQVVARHPELEVLHTEETDDDGVLEARHVDGVVVRLHVVEPQRYGTALFTTTGPEAHVAALGPLPCVADEADVYRALGLPPVPAELRDAPDALEQARGEGFDDLLTDADLQGIVHCHTTWSDGRDTVLSMARAAEALGASYLVITDHSAAAHYAGGLDTDRIRRQWDEIDAVQEQVGIALVKGSEADILADGALDWPDEVLDRLECVVASVHQRYRLGRQQTTERLVRAMRLPHFKIWGHGLGRLLLTRDPVDCDVEAVLDAAAEGKAAIEINASPRRLDLPPRWLREARARGLRFVVSVDAHSAAALDTAHLGVAMARRAGIRRHEVLNTLDAPAFRQAVRPLP